MRRKSSCAKLLCVKFVVASGIAHPQQTRTLSVFRNRWSSLTGNYLINCPTRFSLRVTSREMTRGRIICLETVT